MIFIRMGLFCFKVIGDGEEVANAGMMVSCRGQVCTSQRGGKDGASRQLRKRKKLFGREFLWKKKKSTFLFHHRKKKSVTEWWAHKEKYTFCRPCRLSSNTCDPLTSTPFLPAVCLAEFTQVHPMFCRLRVPSRRASGRKRVRLQLCTARPKISKEG